MSAGATSEGREVPDPGLTAGPGSRAWLRPGELHVWRVDLASPVVRADLLSAAERTRAGRFVRTADRQHFVACRVAVRGIVAAYLGGDPATIAFDEAGRRRPRVSGSGDRLNVSWSRSGDLGLVALGEPGLCIGVDVEAVRALPDGSFLHTAFGDGGGSDRGLLQAWTRLEAALKATGAGLAGLSADIGPEFSGSAPERTVSVDGIDLRVLDLLLGSRAAGAVATSASGPIRLVLRRWPPEVAGST